eukprot:3933641-Rhodomonas_salina.5
MPAAGSEDSSTRCLVPGMCRAVAFVGVERGCRSSRAGSNPTENLKAVQSERSVVSVALDHAPARTSPRSPHGIRCETEP